VDDASPDGTGALAEDLATLNPGRIRVVHRPKKEGLGRAYLDAFARALQGDAEYIVQMDADFSHPTSLLPKLVEALQHFDVALGSRYVPGGRIENWNWKRRLVSRMGNYYARVLLGSPVKDLTGGFKAFRRQVLEEILRKPIASQGYSFQIETTTWALASGFSWTEIPFTFTERREGLSKMSQGIIREAFFNTLRLRKTLRRHHLSGSGLHHLASVRKSPPPGSD
jgi:dolichol-phosphate mannosyltransferase